MNQKGILQDKLKDFRIDPSDRVWHKIENELDAARRNSRRTMLGIAAAVVLVILAYFVGVKSVSGPDYFPMTLEIHDQVSEFPLPVEYRSSGIKELEYRKGGHLIPNAQALWDNPLVPRIN